MGSPLESGVLTSDSLHLSFILAMSPVCLVDLFLEDSHLALPFSFASASSLNFIFVYHEN